MAKISIVIVTYNSQNLITECLDSIGEFRDIEPESVEVLVVDNSSGDHATEMRSLTENHILNTTLKITYLQNKANLGYGQGNNIGIKASSGDIICIMNPDVRLGSFIFKDVEKKFKDQNLALLAYKQIGGFDYSFYLRPEFKNRFTTILTKVANKIDRFNSKYFYLSGAFFFIDKKKFMEIGLFDENIFMYFEEPDLAKRISDKQYKILYDNSKKYYHLVGNRIEYSDRSFESEMQSLKYYLQKFNFDHQKVIKIYLEEYKIKILAAKVLKDPARIDKFKKEVQKIKSVFNL